MTSKSRARNRHALLSAGMITSLKRYARQFTGLLAGGLGVALALSLGTYHPMDPSWNLAIEGPVRNILAFPGAVIADGLLQIFGISASLWILALMGWGIRFMFSLPLRWLFLRSIALGGAVLLAAGAMACWPAPDLWLFPYGLGGALGDILIQKCQTATGLSPVSLQGLSIAASLISLLLCLWSVGITFRESIGGAFTTGAYLAKGVRWLFLTLLQARKWVMRGGGASLSSAKDKVSPFLPDFKNHEDSGHNLDQEQATATPSSAETGEDDPVVRGFLTDFRKEISLAEQNSLKLAPSGGNLKGAASFPTAPHNSAPYPFRVTEQEADGLLPSLTLLDSSVHKTKQVIDPQLLERSALHLKTVLEEFGVRGDIAAIRPGPVVTMYELKPAAGIKTSRVIGLADDIARSMSALSTRIAVIPGRNVIGIELPNASRETVYLRELLQSEGYEKSNSALPLVLGMDIGGHPIIADLARMPHLLVAGTTGSGKSVAINTMILSLLFRLPPDRCKFIMIDPKMLELSVYDGIPHLLAPVVTDPKKAVVALKWTVREMENRYRAMSKLGVRNIEGYNGRIKEARSAGELLIRRVQTGFDPDSGKPVFENQPLDLESLPFIVVVVDEMADLMLVAGKEIEGAVQRLAQMARAAGIHLIMATQRPSVDVITGTIKANFPTRISFQVTSRIDSRTILGEQGAEQLLGQGDMLYMAGGGRIMRVHGPFVRDDEVERIVASLKMQGEPSYIDSVTEDGDDAATLEIEGDKEKDGLYTQAVELVLREGKASTSFIQRHLQIGYNKAAGIIEMMEKNGIVSEANHVGKREVMR